MPPKISAANSAKNSAKSAHGRRLLIGQTKPAQSAKPRARKRKAKAKKSAWFPSALNPKRKPRGKPFETGNAYRWQSGVSGNDAGRPPGPTLRTKLLEMLAQPVPPDAEQAVSDLIAEGGSFAELIAFIAGLNALSGDGAAAVFIRDSTEGAPEQTIHLAEVTSDDLARAREKARAWEAEHESGQPLLISAETPGVTPL